MYLPPRISLRSSGLQGFILNRCIPGRFSLVDDEVRLSIVSNAIAIHPKARHVDRLDAPNG